MQVAMPETIPQTRIIALTMVYNEGAMLQRWLRHYGRHLGGENLLVLDHGSMDGSTSTIGPAGRIRLPRDAGFDDGVRAAFVSSLQANLLRFYNVVIYTDCDEFLVPDPRTFACLRDYVDTMSVEAVRPIGLDVFHDRRREPALEIDRPVLAQRQHLRFFSELCKPIVTRAPIRWVAGFHAADKAATVDPALFLIHLKYADYETAIRRAEITRSIKWSAHALESGWGKRHRADGQEITDQFFDAPAARLGREGDVPLEPELLAKSVNQSISNANGVWRCPPQGGNHFLQVPAWLRDAV